MGARDILHALMRRKRALSAVILAGGASSRFGGETPKQYREIAGLSVLGHTLRAFEACPEVSEIIVVCPEGDGEKVAAIAKDAGISKFRRAVRGGETRQRSAILGFAQISEKSGYVAFHDAARCLITPEAISAVYREAVLSGTGAIACAPVTDTVKKKTALGTVEETLDRDGLAAAATPQIFRENLYRAVAYTAQRDGFVGTDEASLCEHYGFSVRLVDCGRSNIKITYPEDLLFAEAVLKSRGEEKA